MIRTEGTNDPSLERTIAETTVKKFEHAVEQLDPSSPAYADDKAKLETQKLEYQTSEAKRQVEKYPTDLQLRFELGRLCFDSGRITEAIQEFQRAKENPHIRIASMNYLGQCFAKRGMDDLAARTFQTAIKEKSVFDDEKKELIYLFGCVLEKRGKQDEAIEQFKQIYEVDIGYRDVAAKVDAYYSGKG
jgi:tetratricopeptide (TPR) repeat protein